MKKVILFSTLACAFMACSDPNVQDDIKAIKADLQQLQKDHAQLREDHNQLLKDGVKAELKAEDKLEGKEVE